MKAENVTVGTMHSLGKRWKFWPSPIEWLHDATNKNQEALIKLQILGLCGLLKAPKKPQPGATMDDYGPLKVNDPLHKAVVLGKDF